MMDRDAGRERRRGALSKFFEMNRDALKSVNNWALKSGVAERTVAQFMDGSRSKNMRSDTYERLSIGASGLLCRHVSISELMGDTPEVVERQNVDITSVRDDSPGAGKSGPTVRDKARGELVARIDSRLKQLNLTARAASIAAGGGPDVIRDIKRASARGRVGRATPEIEAGLCRVLGVSPDFFTTDARVPPPDDTSLGKHLARVDAILTDAHAGGEPDDGSPEMSGDLERQLRAALDSYPPGEREMIVRLILSAAPKPKA